MIKKIKKRNAQIVKFDIEKITEAIKRAGKSTDEFDTNRAKKLGFKVLRYVEQMFKSSIPSVEDIQDIVETVLMESTFKETAKAYILYREGRSHVRNLDKGIDMIKTYIGKQDWTLKENASSSYSLQGMNNYVTNAVVSNYWLNCIYPKDIREAHIDGDIHIHDLSSLSSYCIGWDLMDLLMTGFRGVEDKIDAGPAKHFGSALGQMFNFIYTLQGEAAGAEAFSNVDTLLAPFIYYDKLSYNDVKQEIQQLMFNLNVPTRVGYQQPFSNLTFDIMVSPNYKDQQTIIGGEPQEKKYSEFQKEMNIFNKAFFEVMYEGDFAGRPFSFPIPTYNITEDFDWNNPVLEDLWKMTGKFGIPYFANYISSDMSPEDARSMCCRLRLDNRDLSKRIGGMFASAPLTGSIGVVTINLPRLGYICGDEDSFFEKLKKLISLSTESLSLKKKTIESFTETGLYPYSKFYLRSVKEQTGFYWSNHFETIGIIGMHEACLNLFGKGFGIDSIKGKEFSVKVLNYIKEILEDLNNKNNSLYNLEATPAEGVCYRLAQIDKNKYKDIITSGEDESYYTNSTFLPVDCTSDILAALQHQEELQKIYTGGTVFHGFLGEEISDFKIVKDLIKLIATNFQIPYFTITPTYSICRDHGYFSGKKIKCPECNKNTEVFSRVVGYYRPTTSWNEGKQEEFSNRKEYSIDGVI